MLRDDDNLTDVEVENILNTPYKATLQFFSHVRPVKEQISDLNLAKAKENVNQFLLY